MNKNTELKNQYYNWVMKIQFAFLENDLFQPIGLELSCAEIVLETSDDYFFKELGKTNIGEKNFPLAFYRNDDDSIHIFIDHESFKKRESDSEKMAFLMFLLFHEANHRLLMHTKRAKEKDPNLYNIAADMEIHNMFYVYNELMKHNNKYSSSLIYQMTKNYVVDFLFKKTDINKQEGLFEEEFLQNTAEEIYSMLQNSSKIEESEFEIQMNSEISSNSNNSNSSNSNNGVKIKVKKITYKSPSKKEYTTTIIESPEKSINDNESDETEKNKETAAMTRKTLMENNLQKEIEKCENENKKFQRGNLSEKCKIFLKKLLHVKVDWKKILRNSLQTALEKSEYFSWASPRTSLFGLQNNLYLPGQIDDECAYGTVIIARDESGSMTDEECKKAAGIIADSKEHYKKIVLIKHDVKITSVNEIEELDDEALKILLKRDTVGGTSHKKVFQFIRDYEKNNKENERISCCIFITDMMSDIKQTQDIIPSYIPKIWLTPPSSAKLFDGSVSGKIIPIEL